MDGVFKELQVQMQLPARADFVALSMGHALLGLLLLLGLWLYVSMRLWRAARRRLQGAGRRPLLQVLRSTCRWLLSAAHMVAQGLKLALLLALELGAFPVFAGLWLDLCVLPLTASSVWQRGELLAKAPLISAIMHWVIGVGFVLAFTFLVCVLREVLRPGALPFIKDPTNPERNPVREMLDEPLLKHLGRLVVTWLAYAGMLCCTCVSVSCRRVFKRFWRLCPRVTPQKERKGAEESASSSSICRSTTLPWLGLRDACATVAAVCDACSKVQFESAA
jgi:E3 ubiquitin-protein ligase MARCH6